MTVQLNIHDLKNRAFELEIERAAIRMLIKIYEPAALTENAKEGYLKLDEGVNGDDKALVVHQMTSAEPEGVVTMADKPKKRTYKKRKPSVAPQSKDTQNSDVLKGLKAIGEYIGVTEGNAWALAKSHDLPVHKDGMFTVASKKDLRRWVLTHPKYKITEEVERQSEPSANLVQSDESFFSPPISGRTKTIHKRCKVCNVMIHRIVPEDFNASSIQFHSPDCKKEWELDHKAGER